jgi:hypothetical protein
MSTAVLVLGSSGSGKSAGLRNVNPSTSFLVQVVNKPLPFKGAKERWTEATKENPTGNVLCSDDANNIVKYMNRVSEGRPEINAIFIDDSQYVMANEFMRSANEKGYEKFTRLGLNFWNLVRTASELRPDLTVFFLHHTETNEFGDLKAKTIGKMLDEKITIEGLFSIVIRAAVVDGKHLFLTQTSGRDPVKTPMGMFGAPEIDNDLKTVLEAIQAY